MLPMWVTLLGEPGAGKTMLGQRLEANGVAAYISGSALLDGYIRDRGPCWEAIKAHKDAGGRAHPDFTHWLLRERLARLDGEMWAALDGFPKSADELARTEASLPGGRIELAILLDVPAAVRIDRVSRRRICNACGQVSTAVADSSCTQSACDGTLTARIDDRPEILAARLAQEPVELLAAGFRGDGRLHVVDASRSADHVYADVVDLLQSSEKAAYSSPGVRDDG
jgi:adenylate kinase